MPDTTDYMLMGYAIAFFILAFIIGSIWWRFRSLEQDEAMLEQLEQEDNPTANVQSSPQQATETHA